MKKHLLPILVFILVITGILYAQSGSGTAVRYEFCELYFRSYCYDQSGNKMWVRYANRSENLDGGSVSGLNAMGDRGWELVTAYLDEFDCGTDYTYVLRRKK